VKASSPSLLFFLALPGAVSAAATAPTDATLPATGLLQVLLALGVVLAAIAAFAWFLRRMTPGAIGSRGWLRIVGGAMVGPKERVVLVEIGETWLLLGVAASNVSLLYTLPKPAQSVAPEGETAAPGFSGALLQALASRRKKS
jgi:flagellar protein FliO/FliZ